MLTPRDGLRRVPHPGQGRCGDVRSEIARRLSVTASR